MANRPILNFSGVLSSLVRTQNVTIVQLLLMARNVNDNLSFQNQPSNTASGQPMIYTTTVNCNLAEGGGISTGYTSSLTLDLDYNPDGFATITAGNVANAVAGTASFPGLIITINGPANSSYPLTLIAYPTNSDTNKIYSPQSEPFIITT